MCHRPPQLLLGDLFAGNLPDDRRPGDEHIAGFFDHEYPVGHRRGVDRTTSSGAHDCRNLRDDAGGTGIAEEYAAISMQGINPFLNSCPTGVIEAYKGDPGAHSQIHNLAYLLRVHLSQRAAHRGKILGKGAHLAAVNRPVSGHHALCRDNGLIHPEESSPMADKHVKLVETAAVEKGIQPFPSGQLARVMLLLNALRPAQGFLFSLSFLQLLQTVGDTAHQIPPR